MTKDELQTAINRVGFFSISSAMSLNYLCSKKRLTTALEDGADVELIERLYKHYRREGQIMSPMPALVIIGTISGLAALGLSDPTTALMFFLGGAFGAIMFGFWYLGTLDCRRDCNQSIKDDEEALENILFPKEGTTQLLTP